ncbi:polysaccharide biosynthesis protein [Aggregicoccus sp. 17bor-14]|uniref:nucleoside-diphosphate sugar epimerase/dehydratase n=1 Tax=Myxococcaceae TaxID=31 RepID=UPI00129CA040|nr:MULTISPECIES: nucleoside-diphosphate sugar epimerase/dehydratase [Myxococcaceae]MBF5043472.1 polysaccharide biosynthesis protein [Simulacricoccus sp. 17bor-14]MRI89230.1 polysaccharide biosynthesis protein [Aggregicoccus sp. 17bor-14]
MADSLRARQGRALHLSPHLRPPVVLLLDLALTAASLVNAAVLRFDGAVPGHWVRVLGQGLPLLLAARAAALGGLGLHRWSFHGAGLNEAGRLVLAGALGTLLFEAARAALGLPRWPSSVLALELLSTTGLLGAYRFAPRMMWLWQLDQQRARDTGKHRTLIVGAGNAGELLLHDLQHNAGCCFHVVGLVDDDRAKHGTCLHGKPVLGPLSRLPELIARHGVGQVLIAIPKLPPERLRELLGLCRRQSVSFKIMPASLAEEGQRLSASMLHDLSPEHLLPRDAVAFDARELQRLVAGRRILITGAAGSIGSELARQVASLAPASLVLLDMNENELYLLARRLEERHPQLAISAIVADIRDRGRLLRLGREHAPHYVFHAAAHKHVPLMERAPEEAVKNNVFGTLNVARMAHACGVERFVLISTDKAVHPSSVMGASKRLAEMVVRAVASRSGTAFTAVRFGNVLGSAGSVVPLFKEQIQRGGPITITHPDCTRYFMTIPEAVGLLMLAGLGGYGELCVLDMGVPVRIAELAENMVTMAGLVPGKDIPIVFTGLRPGEKLTECLLTEEEESSHLVRDRICVAHSPPPPEDFLLQLGPLHLAAQAGDASAVRRELGQLVPSYTPAGLLPAATAATGTAPAPAEPRALERPAPAAAAGWWDAPPQGEAATP